uniref:Si:ch211-255p10.3 n=1 Tax=Paramormyrops kingsleyae TaxID=1676925 RepID=A0A3B3RY46_9TELE
VCQVIKEDLDKSVKEKGEEGCKELLEAFQACLKTTAEGT